MSEEFIGKMIKKIKAAKLEYIIFVDDKDEK